MRSIRASTWVLLVICVVLFGTVVKTSMELELRRQMEFEAISELERYRFGEVIGQLDDFHKSPDLLHAESLANAWSNFISETNAFLRLNRLGLTPRLWEDSQYFLRNNVAYKFASDLDGLVANNQTISSTLIKSIDAISQACDSFTQTRWDIRTSGSGHITLSSRQNYNYVGRSMPKLSVI